MFREGNDGGMGVEGTRSGFEGEGKSYLRNGREKGGRNKKERERERKEILLFSFSPSVVQPTRKSLRLVVEENFLFC